MSTMEIDSEDDEEAQLIQAQAVIDAEIERTLSCSSSIRSASSNNLIRNTSATSNGQYDKVQKVLALNKLIEEKLQRLEKVLLLRFKECQQRLKDIQSAQVAGRVERQSIFRYVNCGKPYFRDKNNFPAPDNEDTITMKRVGMCDLSNVVSVPGWTVKDKTEFLKEILKMSRDLKKNELRSKIAQLQREIKETKNKDIKKMIATVHKEIEYVDKTPLNEYLVLPLDQEYDWDSLAAKLNRRHYAQEYRSLWKLFLHPSINKKNWTKAEHFKLQEIARAHSMQDWEAIAKELNTGRTGYQCFVYFRTNMGNTFTGQKWTKDEEEYLRRLIDYYREDDYIPWGKVAASMENRTKIQIYNKYSRLEEQRKGRFLPEEDAVILNCIEQFGTNFKKIAKFLPGRSVSQLRTRYAQSLCNKTRTSTVWTVEEDKKLVQLMANQDSSFINYASLTKYFPDKDRVQLRARYVTLVKWMRRHPNKDITKAPRRGARRLGHGRPSENLNQAVENLKKRIMTEIATKKSNRISRNSSEDAIEHAIVATLINEHKRAEEINKIEKEEDPVIPANSSNDMPTPSEINIKQILLVLGAKLRKDMFMASSYSKQYPGLTQVENESCLVKVKSYSKRNKQNVIDIGGLLPDIWGNAVENNNQYVLPPNYSTITGCRKLLMYFSHRPQTESETEELSNFNLHYLMRRNEILKEQMELLRERFNTLFLWPFLLSNRSPKVSGPKQPYMENVSRTKRYRELLGAKDVLGGITIPKQLKNTNYKNKIIDGDDDGSHDNVQITLDMVFEDNSDDDLMDD